MFIVSCSVFFQDLPHVARIKQISVWEDSWLHTSNTSCHWDFHWGIVGCSSFPISNTCWYFNTFYDNQILWKTWRFMYVETSSQTLHIIDVFILHEFVSNRSTDSLSAIHEFKLKAFSFPPPTALKLSLLSNSFCTPISLSAISFFGGIKSFLSGFFFPVLFLCWLLFPPRYITLHCLSFYHGVHVCLSFWACQIVIHSWCIIFLPGAQYPSPILASPTVLNKHWPPYHCFKVQKEKGHVFQQNPLPFPQIAVLIVTQCIYL